MIEISGDAKTVAMLYAKRDRFGEVLGQTMEQVVLAIKNNVVSGHLSGPTGANSLSRRTGALSRAVQKEVTAGETTIEGRVFYTGDVPYARIHELGGVINHPGGTAYFFGDAGRATFVSNSFAAQIKGGGLPRTQPHKITIPARAPMRTGFKEEVPRSIALLKAAITAVAASQ